MIGLTKGQNHITRPFLIQVLHNIPPGDADKLCRYSPGPAARRAAYELGRQKPSDEILQAYITILEKAIAENHLLRPETVDAVLWSLRSKYKSHIKQWAFLVEKLPGYYKWTNAYNWTRQTLHNMRSVTLDN